MNNLRSNSNSGFTFQEYLIDATHSNYANSTANGGVLEMVQNSTQAGATSFSRSIAMGANSIVMVVLTPPQLAPAPAAAVGVYGAGDPSRLHGAK